MLGRRWLVSRKRTSNLFDLTNVWKKAVLHVVDKEVAVPTRQRTRFITDPAEYVAALNRTTNPKVSTLDTEEELNVHQRDSSDDEYHPDLGRMSKRTN